MKPVDLYLLVRQSVFVEGRSRRETARLFGIARKTVDKMCAFSVPPGYRRKEPAARPKLDRFTGIIDQILANDPKMPVKQRHTAKRIFERLKAEHGFTGGYTIIKEYVAEQRLRSKEMFVPLYHPPGQPFYSSMGRPSIDPELMVRMLIIGYCQGIRSERRLCEAETSSRAGATPEGGSR